MDPFIMFETDPLGGAVGGEEPLGEPEPVEEAWAPSREEFVQLQQGLGQMAQYIQQQQAAQNGDQDQMPDPYDDPQGFRAWQEKLIDERIAPFQEFRQQTELQEGESRAMDIIHDLEQAEGEFLLQPSQDNPLGSAGLARMLADEYLDEAEARHGQGPHAAEAALTRAVKQVRAMEDQIGKAYYDRTVNQMRTNIGAPRQPPQGPAAAAQVSDPSQYTNEMDVVRAYTGGGR